MAGADRRPGAAKPKLRGGRARAPKIRNWRREDIPAIIECYKAAYPSYHTSHKADKRAYELELEAFPEGQFLAEVDGRVVGYATSLIVQLDESSHLYTYHEITGYDTFSTHDPTGDTLYGADIAVHPEFRGTGMSQRLYEKRKQLVRRNNLRRMVAYGRLPGYQQYAGKMTADQYVEKVTAGVLKDPALSAHLRAGYTVKQVLLRYVPDVASLGHSTFLEWLNPDYKPQKRKISAGPLKSKVRKIRVCAGQFLLRRLKSWEEFVNTVEFFVDSADAYHCHFLVMPELFTVQLFSTMSPGIKWEEARERLVELTPRYIELFQTMAKERQLYIIGGSHPIRREGKLYNTAHLFTPSGRVVTQDKLHITPGEREDWETTPGDKIRIFDTPFARIAIQVCYDIEFPEVARLLALRGVEVVFIPFSTDERKAYNRVRYSAQARAVENYFYVVLAGNVGNLPTIKNYLLNYGQSAVLTPSDLAFPLDAIAAEADPNVETVVVADLDLTTLALQREMGTVRPFFDRRPDLYELRERDVIEIISID